MGTVTGVLTPVSGVVTLLKTGRAHFVETCAVQNMDITANSVAYLDNWDRTSPSFNQHIQVSRQICISLLAKQSRKNSLYIRNTCYIHGTLNNIF